MSRVCERTTQLIKKNKLATSLIIRNKLAVCSASYIIVCKLLQKEVKRNKKRKFWVSQFLKSRDSLTVVQDIPTKDRSTLFENSTRIAPEDINSLLSKITPKFLQSIQTTDPTILFINNNNSLLSNSYPLWGQCNK